MEELFEELVYKHLDEYYPRTKFCTLSGEIAGTKYVYIDRKNDGQTYIYLTRSREKGWYTVITTNFEGKDILIGELSILGFMVVEL